MLRAGQAAEQRAAILRRPAQLASDQAARATIATASIIKATASEVVATAQVSIDAAAAAAVADAVTLIEAAATEQAEALEAAVTGDLIAQSPILAAKIADLESRLDAVEP